MLPKIRKLLRRDEAELNDLLIFVLSMCECSSYAPYTTKLVNYDSINAVVDIIRFYTLKFIPTHMLI